MIFIDLSNFMEEPFIFKVKNTAKPASFLFFFYLQGIVKLK